jgi:uncharacterized protein YciI
MEVLTPEVVMQKVSAGKQSILLHLIAGKPADKDEARMNEMQMEHLTHLFRMEQEGKVTVFGPIINHDLMKGIVVFNTSDRNEVDQWIKSDPYIQSGYLNYEMFDFFTIPGQQIT